MPFPPSVVTWCPTDSYNYLREACNHRILLYWYCSVTGIFASSSQFLKLMYFNLVKIHQMSLLLSHTRKEWKRIMNFRLTVSYHKSLCKYLENATQTTFFPCVVRTTVQEISFYFKYYDMTQSKEDLREGWFCLTDG